MTRDELSALQGKATGNLQEGEQITLQVVNFSQLRYLSDGKLMTALGLVTAATLSSVGGPVPY